jgi:hypothetical protein
MIFLLGCNLVMAAIDKPARNYRAVVTLAAIILWLR